MLAFSSDAIFRDLRRFRGFPRVSVHLVRWARVRAFCGLVRGSRSFWLQRFPDVFPDDLQRGRACFPGFPCAGIFRDSGRFAAFPGICPFSRVSCLLGLSVASGGLSRAFYPPGLRSFRVITGSGCSGSARPGSVFPAGCSGSALAVCRVRLCVPFPGLLVACLASCTRSGFPRLCGASAASGGVSSVPGFPVPGLVFRSRLPAFPVVCRAAFPGSVSRFCPIPAGDIMSTDRAVSGIGFRGGLPPAGKSVWLVLAGLGGAGNRQPLSDNARTRICVNSYMRNV